MKKLTNFGPLSGHFHNDFTRSGNCFWRVCLGALAFCTALSAGAQPEVYYHSGSTRKVSQLTGDWDRAHGVPTISQTDTKAGFWATDLGSTFEHNGELVFLFGDTWGGRDGLLDTFGISNSTSPWDVLMEVPLLEDGKWRPITPDGLAHDEFCVPSHGISAHGSMYAVFTQPDSSKAIMRRSFMIVSHDDGVTWQTLYELDNGNPDNPVFVNVWLERRGKYIYMFGSGAYRASSPTLARIPVEQFPEKSAWEYYAGESAPNAPAWSSSATDSMALFSHEQVGEFSCLWVDQLSCWVMLYNSSSPRGIVMRTASEPTGPWSEGQVIMSPHTDGVYGDYMHISWDHARQDFMADPDREFEFGGEYGPYLISRFTTGTAERCELYYTMSTWNPYQVVIMKSVVGMVPGPPLPAAEAQLLDHGRWSRFPANVADEFFQNDLPYITTFTAAGADANQGWLWQRLPMGTQRVSFDIHGGHSEVFLLESFSDLPSEGTVAEMSAQLRSGMYGRVVRRATGVDANAEITWDWSTTAYDNTSLAVVVLDALDEPWGFVSLSELSVLAPMPLTVADEEP